MLIFKSKNKLLVIGTLLLIAIHSLNTVFLSVIIGNVITAATEKSMDVFINYLIIGILGFLFFMIIGVLIAKFKSKAIKLQNTEIKETMINYIVRNSKYNDDEKESLSLLTNDLKQLETKGIEAEYNIVNLVFTFTFALIGSFAYDVWITVAFLIGSILAVLIAQLFKNKINIDSNNWRIANASYTNKLKGYLLGMETVKTYQVEDIVIENAATEANKMETKLEKMNFSVESTNQILYVGVMILSFLIPLGIGVYRMIEFGVTFSVFMAIVQLSNSLRSPALQSTQVVNEYSTTKPIRRNYLKARDANKTNVIRPIVNDFETININNAKLQFNNKTIFNNANFEVKKGDKILVFGPSGIGKSTLLRVIQQTVELNSGNYYLNNNETNKDLSKLFSLIRQQPLIFDETIIYNITLGESFTKEEVFEATKLAQLEDVINEKGLDYRVGENGNNLSIGELQRVEIARALIRKRPIILADEITSSLDNSKAKAIRKELLNNESTLIEVSHNISDHDKSLYTKVWDLQYLNKNN